MRPPQLTDLSLAPELGCDEKQEKLTSMTARGSVDDLALILYGLKGFQPGLPAPK